MPVFDDRSLQQAVSLALSAPDIPIANKGAMVLAADDNGAKVVIAAKIGNHWRVQSVVDHPWSGGLDAGVSVKATW